MLCWPLDRSPCVLQKFTSDSESARWRSTRSWLLGIFLPFVLSQLGPRRKVESACLALGGAGAAEALTQI
jgi:hypothetical protein